MNHKFDRTAMFRLTILVMLTILAYILSMVAVFSADAESDCHATPTVTKTQFYNPPTVTGTATPDGLPTPAPTSNATVEPWAKMYAPMVYLPAGCNWQMTCYDTYCSWECVPNEQTTSTR